MPQISRRKLLLIATKLRNSWKFSPSKVSRYMVISFYFSMRQEFYSFSHLCPPDSSDRLSFQTPPKATFTSSPSRTESPSGGERRALVPGSSMENIDPKSCRWERSGEGVGRKGRRGEGGRGEEKWGEGGRRIKKERKGRRPKSKDERRKKEEKRKRGREERGKVGEARSRALMAG